MRRLSSVFALGIVIYTSVSLSSAQAGDGQQQFAEVMDGCGRPRAYARTKGTCTLSNGQQIEQCRLGYRTWGRLNVDRSNAILFPTWFSGNSGQIGGFIGANKMLDPARYFIVAVDALGDGVSSSPSNSIAQHGTAFPAFTTRDMVRAEYRLAAETLHLKHLHAVIGQSMGGMQTFEWMVDYPAFMDDAIPMVGSTKLTSYDLLLWTSEENAIKEDPAWHSGNYTQKPAAGEADSIHQMHLTTPTNYVTTHPAADFPKLESEYMTKGILPFDANDWLAQLEAMIHHDVAHGGPMKDAAQRVKARVLVVAAAQDHMVNPGPALDFAKRIGAKTLVLQSDCGHLSPGCEADKMYPVIREFLAEK